MIFKKNKHKVDPSSENQVVVSHPKKRKRRLFIILGIAAVLIVIFIILRMRSGDAAVPVETTEVSKGDIEVILNYSGTTVSAETKSYYAEVTAPVSELSFKAGDRVEKGDILYRFDPDELNLMKEKATLTQEQAEGSYSGSMEKNAKASVKVTGQSLTEINSQIDTINAQIKDLNGKVDEKTARIQRTLTDLQKTTLDVDQNGISDSTDAAEGNTAPVDRRTDEEDESKKKQMSLALQEAISEVQYALQYDPEILSWKKQINDLTEQKNLLTEAASAESSRLTSGEKTSLEAQKELTELENQSTLQGIEDVEGGIRAEFSGVVTEVTADEGATVSKGSKVITVTSTDDVRINIQISKADIGSVKEGQDVDITIGSDEYKGKVSKISGTATKNSNGIAVLDAEITISDPTDSIILGIEAKTKIHTDRADDVVVLPFEYIGTDADGDYVYMIGDDGMLERRNITIGLSTATDAEITEGLSAGDVIVATAPDTLTEGTQVVALTDAGQE